MAIEDIDALRNFALFTLTRLSKGEITTEEAGVTGKLCENVVSTLKVQLEYAKMLGEIPKIDFLKNSTIPETKLMNASKRLHQIENKEEIFQSN